MGGVGSLPWEDVSARETEVLAAVGEHLTNAQIASRLHISARTVESHVSALLRKCGASDRRELAVLAAQVADLEMRPDDAVLPEARTSFVGRVEELDAVRIALATSRLVTLTGPGGVGKTRLAIAAAGEAAPRFPAGVVYVDLVPVRAGQVVPAMASTLGVTERPPRPLLASVADRVRRRVMLMVLDNCEHVLDEVGGVVEVLLRAGRQLRILTTSRERLGIAGEEARAVPSLPLRSDAEALFLDRARGVDRSFTANPGLVTAACARLDGLPLGIELAAARAAAIGIDGLLTALEDQLRVVTGARGGEARHHSLRDVLGWSYDLLEPAERVLFSRLAVFAAGFDLDAAAAVSPHERPSAVAHLLGRLVEKSLVVRRVAAGTDRTRYRLLETVRAFATERLRDSGEHAAAQRAHLEWASRVAVELADRLDASDWPARYEEVVDDLRAALLRTDPTPDPVAHRLGRALAHLACARGDFVESRTRSHAAADRATSPGDTVRDLRSASEAAQCLADGEDAFDLLLAGADRADTERDRAVMLALAVIVANRFAGDFRHAVPAARRDVLLRRALRAHDESDHELTAVLLTARAWQAGAPRPEPDRELAEAAVKAAHDAGDPILIQGALDCARSAAASRGELREACRITRERLDLMPTLAKHRPADAIEMFDLFHSAAVCALAIGDLPQALAIAARATAEDPVNGDYPFVSRMKFLAPLALSGRFDDAVRLGETAYAEWQRAGAPLLAWLSPSLMSVALAAALRDGDEGPWRSRALELAGVAEPGQSRHLVSFAAFVDARLAVHTGNRADVARLVRDAFEEFPQPWYRAYANAAGAELAVLAGLSDAPERLAQAERTCVENEWAAACVARARGRLTGDRDAIRQSIAGWERLGARFELEFTRRPPPRGRG
ncbi:MAG TPA: LuxR C-terminal-related transcriptional regulator [Actinophytocola sp.]|nr:LuxR C-terminal-related transcriptional regulator [Actinophytocola sp.]